MSITDDFDPKKETPSQYVSRLGREFTTVEPIEMPRPKKLSAGRDLDALIAEKVMGCKVLWQASSVSGPYCGCNCDDGFQEGPHSDSNRLDENLKNYSTDIVAAWEVVEKLKTVNCKGKESWGEQKDEFPIIIQYCPEDKEWNVRWAPNYWAIEHDTYALTAPLAICLAALKVVEK